MKMLTHLLQKTQDFVNGSWMKVLVISLVLSAPISPLPVSVNVPGLSPNTVQAAGTSLTSGNAETEFKRLFTRLRSFAGFLLIIGIVVAGIFFVMGKHQMAIYVFVGAIVVYGGAFIIQLINDSFSSD